MREDKTQPNLPPHIDLPAPTMWPMVTAFGLALMAAGLVTNLAVSLTGFIIALAGAICGWRDVLPGEKHEHVPLRPTDERAAPVRPVPATVEYLKLGELGHMHVFHAPRVSVKDEEFRRPALGRGGLRDEFRRQIEPEIGNVHRFLLCGEAVTCAPGVAHEMFYAPEIVSAVSGPMPPSSAASRP